MQKVTLIQGDGISPEVTASARDIVLAKGAAVELRGARMCEGERSGTPLTSTVFDSIARNRIVIKGPTQTTFGGD